MGLKEMGTNGAGNSIVPNGGSSSPKTPAGAGQSNKSMPASSNIQPKGGGSIGVK